MSADTAPTVSSLSVVRVSDRRGGYLDWRDGNRLILLGLAADPSHAARRATAHLRACSGYSRPMSDSVEAARLHEISTLLSRGDLSRAEAQCRDLILAQPTLLSAVHLLGLIRDRQGDTAHAERLLRYCASEVPTNADFQSNLGNFLRNTGQLREAETAYRKTLALRPDDRPTQRKLALVQQDLGQPAQAEATARAALRQDEKDPESWSVLGHLLNQQSRFEEAETALRRSLTLEPAQHMAEHNLALALLSTDRAEEALETFEQAATHGVCGFEWHVNHGRALISLSRTDAAIEALRTAVAERPADLDAQFTLARLRHLRGDSHCEEAITHAARSSADPGLHWLESDILRRSHRLPAAENGVRAAIERLGRQPRLLHGLSQILLDQKRLAEAESTAIDAATALPDDSAIVENLVAVLLARGRPRDALEFIERWRAKRPQDQVWIAYQATAARALGEARSATLNDYGRFVKLYDLSAPAGWAGIEPFNQALASALRPKLTLNHAPFEQDPRSGRCSADNLTFCRAPIIQAALKWCAELLPVYLADIGPDPDHPLTARSSGAAYLSSARAVELRQGGSQRNHVHRRGWISAIYYVSVPETDPEQDARDGWLRLGQPPHSDPNATPECLVQPLAGRLVLFPSYFWHGTQTVTATDSLLALSFDAIPMPAGAGDEPAHGA